LLSFLNGILSQAIKEDWAHKMSGPPARRLSCLRHSTRLRARIRRRKPKRRKRSSGCIIRHG
jgi:hypothetical protein